MYVRNRTWIEYGPARCRQRGLGATATWSSSPLDAAPMPQINSDPIIIEVPGPILSDPAGLGPLPNVPMPVITAPAPALPCLPATAAGPLAPGQQYCSAPVANVQPLPCVDPSFVGPILAGQSYCSTPAPAAAPLTMASLWSQVQPYALPVGVGLAALVVARMFGGRR